MGIELGDNLSARLADAIRNISAMISSGASYDSIASATAQCAAAMLPGARAIVVRVLAGKNVARILASANAPFVKIGDDLLLDDDTVLKQATKQPFRLHHEFCKDSNLLFPTNAGFPGEPDEVISYKAAPRAGAQSIVLAIVSDQETAAHAGGVLMALSELLIALCAGRDATVLQDKCQADIARAKHEWERTVDALPEVVCLVDPDGRILRTNRTIEHWGLGDVTQVRGMDVHALFHSDCTATKCPLRDAVSISMAAQSEDGFIESIITDEVLVRKLVVQTRLMNDLPTVAKQAANPSAVIIVSDISALHRAQQELSLLNQDLEKRVQTRTSELEAANRDLGEEVVRRHGVEVELQTSRDELAELTQQLINTQEDERSRISRELHDSVGQSLGAIKYTAERVAAMYENPDFGDPAQEMSGIIDSLSRTIAETRDLAISLRPPALDDLGPASAIRWLCENFAKTYADVAFHIEIEATDSEIPDRLSTPVYRITQEAMNNVIKHANAKAVMVALRVADETLQLEVLDDGTGFDNSSDATGNFRKAGKIGRLGMRERAVNSNGVLKIESWPGEGTRVTAQWALTDARIGSE